MATHSLLLSSSAHLDKVPQLGEAAPPPLAGEGGRGVAGLPRPRPRPPVQPRPRPALRVRVDGGDLGGAVPPVAAPQPAPDNVLVHLHQETVSIRALNPITVANVACSDISVSCLLSKSNL